MISNEPLHPYSIALLSAVPIPDPVEGKRKTRIPLQGKSQAP